VRSMSRFKWFGSVGLILLSFTLVISNCAKKEETSTPKEYVIGGMQALSGPGYAAIVDFLLKASKLAVNEINEAGGINGIPMKIIWEDHKARGPDAVSALNKLVDINKVPVATIGYTAPVMATAPIAEERETLLINHGAYGPAIVGCGKYTFHLTANELVLIRAMLDYAKNNMGVKTLGLIYVNDDMGISVRDFIRNYCPKIGITYKGDEAFDLAATDYSAQIAKARGWNADAVYLSIHKHPITKQANDVGWHPLWIGCPLYTLSEFLKWGPGIEGAIAAAADVSFERNPGMVKMKESWENIRVGAKRAVEKISKIKPYKFKMPIHIEADTLFDHHANAISLIPGVERITDRTIVYESNDFRETFDTLLAITLLAYQAQLG